MGIGKMGEIIKVMKIIDDTNNLEVIHLPSESNQFTEEITKNHGNSTTDKQSNVMTEDTDNTDTETKNSTQNKLSKDKISITTEDDTTQNVSHDKENTNNENVSHDKENTNNENVSECSRKRRQPKAIIQEKWTKMIENRMKTIRRHNKTEGKYKKRKPSDLSDVDINPDKLLQLKVKICTS
ncbi:hypothetical protein TKK_0014665 [Trichogramma kaykai]